jgi:hypothetical protein
MDAGAGGQAVRTEFFSIRNEKNYREGARDAKEGIRRLLH